jgi:long-chain acyl-CoA synthetase
MMNDPLSLFPLALAAGGGQVDGFETAQLVAAGHTLLQRSAPLVRALAGRRSAILLPSSPAFVTALAASDGRGAVLVNPLSSAPEVASQLADADVGAVFTTSALARGLPADTPLVLLDDAPRAARVVIHGRDATVDLGSHFGLALEGSLDASGRDEEAVVVYTSAMAGRARGARLTHRNLLSNAHAAVHAAQMTSLDHALAVLPFSHLFGLVVSGAAPLLASARVTTMPRFHPVKALEMIAGEAITLLVGVPAIFAALVQAIERRGGTFREHQLRVCICGGAPLSVSLQEQWAELTGVELRQGYGLTEAGPVCLFNRVHEANRRGTMGVPFPGVEVSIRSPETGDELPPGTEGEICVRGPNVFAGYVGEATDALQVRDGWLRTGDLGATNDDDDVEFRGVLKSMFTRNGFNIYPREIERVVGEMPGVQRVRVLAQPDPARENDIMLEVTGTVAEADVYAWCERQLGAYKQPGLVRIVPAALPCAT